jgi:hypothetical protein
MTYVIKDGTLYLSRESHALAGSLLRKNSQSMDNDAPFESLIDVFMFAFALGYKLGKRNQIPPNSPDLTSRGFKGDLYLPLVGDECQLEERTIAYIMSEYAEAGCLHLAATISDGESVLSVITKHPDSL